MPPDVADGWQVSGPSAVPYGNLGVPQNADRAARDGVLDVVLLGRPALSNPHRPVWAARELGHAPSTGWPERAGSAPEQPVEVVLSGQEDRELQRSA